MPDRPATDDVVLRARGLIKAFPGVVALDRVDLTLRAGEVHAVMGENGAGKSTIIKVMTGVYPRDGGELLLNGKPIDPRSPRDAQKLGISTVYQEVNLIPQLSVAENIALGKRITPGFVNRRRMRREAEAALARLDVHVDVRQPLQQLSIALQQMVAIARALSLSAKVLILDEPTSSLDRAEVAQLFASVNKLKSEGMAILFVTHFLDQVYAVSDRITVLRNGKLVGESLASQLPRLELVSQMVGRDARELTGPHQGGRVVETKVPTDRPAFLEVTGLNRKHAVESVDLSIREGEVVGLAGLLGSGRTETAELLFGVHHADGGTIRVGGAEQRLRHPRQAIALGFGFCTEDRKVSGILPDLSIRENIAITLQSQRGWWRPISWRKQNELAERYIQALGIKTSDAEKPIRLLSGGNQQKCLLARWLASSPKLLILDEPTRGIDIGAKSEIAAMIDRLRADGMSLMVISSDVEELERLCDRAVILRDRRKVGEVEGADVNARVIYSRIAG